LDAPHHSFHVSKSRKLQLQEPAMNSTIEPSLVTDPALSHILAELIRREPIFHRAEFGTTRADFEKMTMDDFWEVGASGRRYSENIFSTSWSNASSRIKAATCGKRALSTANG
jgi:hypothetical protein